MSAKFAFIGAGNMGGAMAEAIVRAKGPESVLLYDHNEEKAKALAEKTGCGVAESARDAVFGGDYVLLCVKPKMLPGVLKGLLPYFEQAKAGGDKKVLVSIAAGVAVESIKSILQDGGVSLPVIRLMPNTPVLVGKGLVLVMPSEDAGEGEVSVLMDALSAAGETELFDEKLVDAATPVFSSSPAFGYMFIEAMADGGVMAGVPRDKAQKLAAISMLGAAAMVLETGKHPGQLKDEVCSPGGSTIVGVEVLERAGFRAAAAQAVYEAYIKTTQLGK